MTAKLIIQGRFHCLNDYISALGENRFVGAALKKQDQELVEWCAKTQLRNYRPTGRVSMQYTWYEPDRRRDMDNISSFGRKVIQDGLVKAGVLKNDGWKQIARFSDDFFVDAKNPRIEVLIEEVV